VVVVVLIQALQLMATVQRVVQAVVAVQQKAQFIQTLLVQLLLPVKVQPVVLD
jgi:hypothetical protein